MRAKSPFFISLFILLFIAGAFSYSMYRTNSTLKESLLSLTQKTDLLFQNIERTEATLALLIEGDEALQARLLEEQEKRLAAESLAEENSKNFQEKIGSLSQELIAQKQAAEAQDLTTIIKAWSPRIAKLNCDFQKADGTITVKGSAVAENKSGKASFLTNKHVVSRNDSTLQRCDAFFPGNNETITISKENLTLSPDADFATAEGFNPGAVPLETFSSFSYCKSEPVLGDQVIILGYPGVGSANTITATNGIISGFDNGYYVTSAKIEQGNSGGAAILVKDNCFLGIPTLVIKGKLESLARIFPVK